MATANRPAQCGPSDQSSIHVHRGTGSGMVGVEVRVA